MIWAFLLTASFFIFLGQEQGYAMGHRADPNFEEQLFEESKIRAAILREIRKIYEQEGLTSEEIKKDGYYHFNDEQSEVIIQRVKNFENTNIGKKVDKAVNKILELRDKDIEIKVKNVDKSYDELVGLQDAIIQYTKEMGINGAISLFEDKSIIELATKNITSCQKKFLEKNYGGYIKITADYEEPFEAKSNALSQGFESVERNSGSAITDNYYNLLGNVTGEVGHSTVRSCIPGFESVKAGYSLTFAPWVDVQSTFGLSRYTFLTN